MSEWFKVQAMTVHRTGTVENPTRQLRTKSDFTKAAQLAQQMTLLANQQTKATEDFARGNKSRAAKLTELRESVTPDVLNLADGMIAQASGAGIAAAKVTQG